MGMDLGEARISLHPVRPLSGREASKNNTVCLFDFSFQLLDRLLLVAIRMSNGESRASRRRI
jgi:hypothetical protein